MTNVETNNPVKILKSLQIFQTLYEKATVNHIIVFMHVISETSKGMVVHMREMPDDLGMTQTTVNRIVRHLGDRSYIHENGLQLVKITTDMTDERMRLVNLTPKGKKIASQMLEKIYGTTS